MSVRKKKRHISVFSVILLIVLLIIALGLAVLRPKGDPARALNAQIMGFVPAENETLSGVDAAVAEAAERCFSVEYGPFTRSLLRASGSVSVTALDAALLTEGLAGDMQALLGERAAAAKRSAELYEADGSVKPTLCETLYADAMQARLSHARDYCRTTSFPVSMRFLNGEWTLENAESLYAALGTALPSRPGYAEAVAALEPVRLHYSIAHGAPSPTPDPDCYGMTDDPRVIAALLETDTAKRLIDGQKLDFDPNRDMLGRSIYYYLDETILALVWQDDEHGAVGTFAEVIVADASQLRRKLADDTFGTLQYYYPSEFAVQTNAVVAGSGDFYNSGRPDYGLYVYDGQLMRSNLHSGQSCFFTDEGDMLFIYEDRFASEEEAQRFIDENHVVFSLSFGPVLIDHGEDVTPYDYPIGEVRDTYARCAVGQLGKRHYLMMTINCESPDHYVYVTLRQAADSMIAHGCVNAYTLDGGQTGSILIGGQLINPVQFGVEREMSDIYYFATALPDA